MHRILTTADDEKTSDVPAAHAEPPPETKPVAPNRVNPDDGRFIRLVVAGVVVAGLVAFAISFTALYEVAAWLGVPPFMWWAVPVFIDLAILVYAASVLVHKARGEQTWQSWAALATFTALSVFANASHALSADHAAPWQGMVGAVIAGMVPVAIFVATEQLSKVAVEDPASRRAELKERARMEQAHAEHAVLQAKMRFERERQEREMARERETSERAAELDRERHRTEIARLHAHRDLEVLRAAQSAGSSPDHLKAVEASEDAEDGNGAHGDVAESGRTAALPVVESRDVNAPDSRAPASGDLDEIAEFVSQQSSQGKRVTAALLKKRFGLSERTWRRRLQILRDKRPDAFHGAGVLATQR